MSFSKSLLWVFEMYVISWLCTAISLCGRVTEPPALNCNLETHQSFLPSLFPASDNHQSTLNFYKIDFFLDIGICKFI